MVNWDKRANSSLELSLKKKFGCLVLFALLLSGCGGGAPYVGLWQCSTDPGQSLEIKRFEEYYVITAKEGDRQFRRDGTFANDIFSVGENNVGQAMALELDGDEITCSKPPNFCHCDSPYKKVESLTTVSNTAINQENTQSVKQVVPDPEPDTAERTILDRDPLTFEMRNGGTVRVFHDADNGENEKRVSDWAKLKYYYLPQFTLAKLTSGSFAEVRHLDDEVSVFFRITARNMDMFELMENIHKSVNPRILAHLVSLLSIERLTVQLPESPQATPVVVPSSELDLKGGSHDISLSVMSDAVNDTAAKLKTGNEIATAINSGSVLLTASFEILQKINAENVIDVSSELVTKTVNVVAPR